MNKKIPAYCLTCDKDVVLKLEVYIKWISLTGELVEVVVEGFCPHCHGMIRSGSMEIHIT